MKPSWNLYDSMAPLPLIGMYQTFKTSNFELDLKTGMVFTYLDLPENIGIPCRKEQFDLEYLTDALRGKHDTSAIHEEKLERIPRVKKIAGPADVMDREEAEYKIHQYCHLWTMYAENLSRTEKEVSTFTRECSSSLQSVRTLHLRYSMSTR